MKAGHCNSRLKPRKAAHLFWKLHIILQKFIAALAFSVTGLSVQQVWFAESNVSLERVAPKNLKYSIFKTRLTAGI